VTDRTPPAKGGVGARLGPWRSAVTFAGVVFVASVAPIPDPGGTPPTTGSWNAAFGRLDALGLTDPFHLAGYAVLAALVTRATGRSPHGVVIAAAVATAFGFGIEMVQATIPWRGFAWRDVLLNAVGASVGAATARTVAVAFRATDSDETNPG